MTVKAIYENGVFRPLRLAPVHLAERTEVEVSIPAVHVEEHTEVEVSIPAEVPLDAAAPTGWKAAEALIGFIEDAPPDMAEHHDAYLRAGRR